ncbi:T9SS type A sorting domain-containing protein [Neptunitalea lumnitzerae]|uniref:Secretion system C-terminal sorting domain-containing protein n=1 Tax=Neptunitalea lumnitzerae TaxID=2965509 RepID=A0ABQ5MH17_9FLAO|nr:T9SS type A sorting domain-containing protein [Neptunitalea sp. Y10]GLB48596.1 hypothetical protein Y10_09640 [Neptunitalea sp. Y10]
MTKTTFKNTLSSKLARYGALTAVIGGAAEASGQIVYTDINPDEGGADVVYFLDMNNDGAPDYGFINYMSSSSIYGYTFSFDLLYGIQASSNMIIGSSMSTGSNTIGYPFVLNAGDVISSGNTNWKDNYYQLMNFNSCGSFSGMGGNANWCNETDKYIGVKFLIGTNYHYGWARFDVSNAHTWLIKDYAYNSTPGASIEAGQTSLSVQDNFVTSVNVVALHKTIALSNLPSSSAYKLISMTGQVVNSGTTKEASYVIEASNLQTGVYIVEVTDEVSGAQIRKKVTL